MQEVSSLWFVHLRELWSLNSPHLNLVLATVGGALLIGLLVRWIQWTRKPNATTLERLWSVLTWIAMTATLALATLLGGTALFLLFLIIAWVGLAEFCRMWGDSSTQPIDWAWSSVLLGAHYLFVAFQWEPCSWVFLPLATVILLPLPRVLGGRIKNFSTAQPRLALSLLTVGYCLAYAPMLLNLEGINHASAGRCGAFWFLILLVESGDIFQSLFGKRFGKRKITPVVSPGKTWAGFCGGLACVLFLSVVLTPVLTALAPGPLWEIATYVRGAPVAMLLGATVFFAGFCGDITMSAWKRDAGVKDSGQLLPGMGGMLDRIDSLTFAAPAFYYAAVGCIEWTR